MNDFLFSINATIPVFLVILLGYILKKIGIINEAFVDTANIYVFKVALPVMLFEDMAFTGLTDRLDGSFIIYCIVVTIIMFLLSWLLTYIFMKDKTQVGAFAQAAVRSSAAILGVAFVENICGEAGMAPLMIASAVPFFNILSVIILTFSAEYGNETDGNRISLKAEIVKSLKGIVTNPIIIGILLGLLFDLTGLNMPTIPLRTIHYISATATPVALIAIGGGFEFRLAATRLKPSMVASFIKLVLLPMIFLPVAVWAGFEGSELVAILIMLASPATVSCYVMAKAMNNDEVLTSNVVVITTLASSITLTAWVYILKIMGLI